MSYNTKQKDIILKVIRKHEREFTIKDIYNRPSFQKKYINVREIDLVAVEHLIEKYCDKYGDGSACISDSEPQQSGVSLSVVIFSFAYGGYCSVPSLLRRTVVIP